MILIFLVVSLVITIVALQTKNPFLKLLNIVSWSIFSVYLYKGIFGWVNLLDMSNDLLLWILRTIGAIFCLVGLLVGWTMFFAGLIFNVDPIGTGLGIIFLGLGFLGVFMLFRSRRRYPHLYLNR